MVDVIAMPPVGYTARAQGLENARSVSRGISGAPRYSQERASRRLISVSIHGIGSDLSGQAWLEQLRRIVDAKPPIVQIEIKPDGWHRAIDAAIKARGHGVIRWTYEGAPMRWTYTEQKLAWWYSSLSIEAGTNNGGDYIDVTVPTPNATIAYPGEKVVQGSTTGRVMGPAYSDGDGNARIYVDTAFQDGTVQISPKEWAYATLDSMPPASQGATGGYTYEWAMTEYFPTDTDTIVVKQPWRIPA